MYTDTVKKGKDEPFYAWDCINIKIRDRWDVNLVFPSEIAMKMFLKLLIYRTNSIDGQRDSSQ